MFVFAFITGNYCWVEKGQKHSGMNGEYIQK